MFLGDGNVKFEFAHVGINAQTPEEGVRMKNFFTEIMGYHDYREIPAGFFTVDNKMELLKIKGKGTMGHLGFFVNDMPAAIKYLDEKGYPVDYYTARYDEDGKTIRLIFLKPVVSLSDLIFISTLLSSEKFKLPCFPLGIDPLWAKGE